MDFRLKVFHSVACNLSFTKASRELFISQPAISKHIHELEVQYKTPLFERTGSQIRLTRAGELLFSHTHSLLASYRQLDFEMNLLTNNFLGDLHLGQYPNMFFRPCLLYSLRCFRIYMYLY